MSNLIIQKPQKKILLDKIKMCNSHRINCIIKVKKNKPRVTGNIVVLITHLKVSTFDSESPF